MKLGSILFLISSSVFSGELTDNLAKKKAASRAGMPKEISQVMKKGVDDLRDLGLHKKAIGVGKRAPNVSFKDLKGKRVELSSFIEKGPVVLTFYRGGWCPYCMLELDAYQKLIKNFERTGAKIIAVSPDSLKEASKTLNKRGLTYNVLTDPGNRAAKLFGIAFKVDSDTLMIYKKFGINLEASQGNSNNELPMPGTYVIDKKGMIRFSFVDPDYTKRADPEDVLKVLRGF